MANYHIGLDFGTSQTKVCLLNKDSDVREFLKFDNNSYFLPSLIVKKQDNTFSYGNENVNGIKYRYFKMAAAEDDHLIQVTNENLQGRLESEKTIDDFRKYSADFQIKPEILVVLYLTYIYLFVKQNKNNLTKVESDFFDDDLDNEILDENTKRIKVVYFDKNMDEKYKSKVKFFEKLFDEQ